VAAVLGGDVAVGGSRAGSRTTTPTVVADGGLEVIAAGEVGIPMIPPFATQQFTEGRYVSPHPLQIQWQLQFMLEVFHHPQQQVAQLILLRNLGWTHPSWVLQAVHGNGLGGNGRAVQVQVM
jgi:hypothetical protein